MWTALLVGLKLPETKHSLLEPVIGLLFSDRKESSKQPLSVMGSIYCDKSSGFSKTA